MRFTTLYRFMLAQLWRNPMVRVFVVIGACGLVWLAVAEKMPSAKLVGELCFIFIPVYFTIATGSNIIEETERPLMELLLAKPFSRRDIVLADYLSVTSIFGLATFTLSIGLWLVFGWRGGDWGIGFIVLFLSLFASFIFLYCFIQLSGLLLRNAAVVVVVWVGYIYFGAALLEAGAVWVSRNGSVFLKLIFYPVFFLLPRLLGIYSSVQGIFEHAVWDVMPVVVSGISSALVLVAAIVYVSRKDIG